MRKIKQVGLAGLLACSVFQANAITIADMAEKNNKILELDQDITIAEKTKKLEDAKGASAAQDITYLPAKVAAPKYEDNMSAISVHGSPDNPVVDLQYGGMVYQKRRGEIVADGWILTEIGKSSVTLTRKVARKPDVTKSIGIGYNVTPSSGNSSDIDQPIAIPSHVITQ